MYSTVVGRSDVPFQFYIGGRGIGKTYSALREMGRRGIEDNSKKFILLRRTFNEIENIATEYANPFKTINRNEGWNIEVDINKQMGLFYIEGEDNEPYVIGYACALSTFAKMRGLDFSDVDKVIFDEFIPEKHVHKIAHEGEAFLHFYETVNRNREFDGEEPLQILALANAINLNNDILLTMGIVSRIANMKVDGVQRWTDKKRGIYVELVDNPEFTEAKGKTALYRATGGTKFSEEALLNNFASDDLSMVGDVKLSEYTPLFAYDMYVVMQHKSTGYLYIKKGTAPDTCPRFENCDRDIMYWRFAPRYRLAKLQRTIKFDSYTTQLVFDALIKRI